MGFHLKSIHHIELTVSNLETSKLFYEKLPGLKVVANYPNFIMFAGHNFNLGLTDHKNHQKEKQFSELNVGMDHVSFAVQSIEDLKDAIKFFDELSIPHGEIEHLSNGRSTLAFRDPDNIQLELIAQNH